MKLYTILRPALPASILGHWEPHLEAFREVVGFTALGNVFLRDPDTHSYMVLYPQRPGMNAKNYGHFDSIESFESEVLSDPEFHLVCLQPDLVASLKSSVGPLGPNQVYIPVPYTFLAGEKGPDSYMVGDVWIFVDIVRQTLDQL